MVFDFVTSGFFETFIMVCIILNIVSMAIVFEGESQTYNNVLENINLFFTIVFIVELCLKLITYGKFKIIIW